MALTLRACIFWGVLAVCLSAAAETVRFTNGATMRGKAVGLGAYVVVRTTDGRVLRVKRSLVASITPDIAAAGAAPAAAPQSSALEDVSSLADILNRPMTVDFQQMPLPDVVQYLRAETGLNFVIDPDIKADEITITLSLKDMRLIAILRWIAEVGKLAIVIKRDGSSVRLASKEYKPEGLALYGARPVLLSVIDRPAQPFTLAEGSSGPGQTGSAGQTGSIKRTAKGRDPQDLDLQQRGHDLLELLVRTTGTANWDNAFVSGRLPERDYLAGE